MKLLVALLLLVCLSSCSSRRSVTTGADDPESDAGGLDARRKELNTPELAETAWISAGDRYTCAVRDRQLYCWGANLTFIWTTTQGLAAKLTVARSVNQKAVVLLQNELFDWTNGLSLRPDWRARWDAMAQVVESGHADTVVAFYPIDEPYWNAYSRGVSDDTMRGWLGSEDSDHARQSRPAMGPAELQRSS